MNKTTTAREAYKSFVMSKPSGARLTAYARQYCDENRVSRPVIDKAAQIALAAGRQFVTIDDIKSST